MSITNNDTPKLTEPQRSLLKRISQRENTQYPFSYNNLGHGSETRVFKNLKAKGLIVYQPNAYDNMSFSLTPTGRSALAAAEPGDVAYEPKFRVGCIVRVVNTDSDDTRFEWRITDIARIDTINSYDYTLVSIYDAQKWTVWGESHLEIVSGASQPISDDVATLRAGDALGAVPLRAAPSSASRCEHCGGTAFKENYNPKGWQTCADCGYTTKVNDGNITPSAPEPTPATGTVQRVVFETNYGLLFKAEHGTIEIHGLSEATLDQLTELWQGPYRITIERLTARPDAAAPSAHDGSERGS